MNTEETQTQEMPGQAEASAATESATNGGSRKAADVASELRELGVRFGAAVKAAASTPEAKELRGEIRDGLSQMRDEIDTALGGLRSGAKKRAGERRGDMAGQVRTEVAQAVRNLSSALEKLAGSVGQPDAAASDDVEIIEAEVVEESSESD